MDRFKAAQTINLDLESEEGDVARSFLALKQIRPSSPGLPFLADIVRAFSSFPYENVTKILRYHRHTTWQQRLRMPEDVIEEHIAFRAGGTCFSLTYCLQRILRSLGYETHIVMGDMPSGPDCHCAVIVHLGGTRFLADPGYLIPQPIPIPEQGSRIVEGGAGPMRVRKTEGSVSLSTLGSAGEKHRYRLKDTPVSREAFLEHWIRSFELPMQNGILVTALRGSTHLYLHNNHFRASLEGIAVKEKVRERYGERIEEVFGIQASLVETVRDILQATGRSRIQG